MKKEKKKSKRNQTTKENPNPKQVHKLEAGWKDIQQGANKIPLCLCNEAETFLIFI